MILLVLIFFFWSRVSPLGGGGGVGGFGSGAGASAGASPDGEKRNVLLFAKIISSFNLQQVLCTFVLIFLIKI